MEHVKTFTMYTGIIKQDKTSARVLVTLLHTVDVGTIIRGTIQVPKLLTASDTQDD